MPQNRKHIITERRQRIAEMYLRGETVTDIASSVGVTPGQVSKDLKRISEAWQQSAIADIEEKKGKELAKLDLIEKKLWEAWERSCDKQHKQRVKKVRAKRDLVEKERELTAMEGIGDPRYISEILKCIQTRIKILGLEKTESRVNLSFDQMSDTQLDGIIDKILNNE